MHNVNRQIYTNHYTMVDIYIYKHACVNAHLRVVG